MRDWFQSNVGQELCLITHRYSDIKPKAKKAIGGTESFVGKSSIEVEVTDSSTGELLADG
jgi:hypothetical protein